MRFDLYGEGTVNDYLAIALFAMDAGKPATEITEQDYNNLFGQLPPTPVREGGAWFGYLVPEPVTHNDYGQVYVMIAQREGKFYAKYVTYGMIPSYITLASMETAYSLVERNDAAPSQNG